MIDLQAYRDAMEEAKGKEELKEIYDKLQTESRPIFHQTDRLQDLTLLPLRNEIVNLNRELNERYLHFWNIGDRVGSRYFKSGTVDSFERDGSVRIKDDATGKNYLVVKRIDLHPLDEQSESEEQSVLEQEQPVPEEEQMKLEEQAESESQFDTEEQSDLERQPELEQLTLF